MVDKRMWTAAEVEAAKEAKREYYRRWRARHADRVKEYELRFYARRAAEYAAEDVDGESERGAK